MGLFRRGKVWWMSFVYRGIQIRKSTETTDRKIAEKIYHKVMAQIVEGKWFERLPGEEKTFREMMEKYLVEHSARNKSFKSHIRDIGLLKHLLPYFGDLTLSEITPKLIAG